MGDVAFSLGRVFARAFALIGRAPWPILCLCLLFGSVPDIIWDMAEKRLDDGIPPEDGVRHVIAGAAMMFAMWLQTCSQAAVTALAIDTEEGRHRGIVGYVALVARLAPALLGLTIINMVAVGIGSVLLLVPGMMIMTIWSVSGSVLAVERTGILAALRRSAQLTKGARWPIFGLILLMVVAILAVTSIVGFAGSAIGIELGLLDPDRRDMVAYVLWMLTGNTVMSAIWAALMASLYLELRDGKDGPGVDSLAEVFA